MIKCKEYLAFVNADTGKIKERFEINYNNTDLRIEGRRPQLIKKLLSQSLEENWITGEQLFDYLKKTKGITGKDIFNWVYGFNPLNKQKE